MFKNMHIQIVAEAITRTIAYRVDRFIDHHKDELPDGAQSWSYDPLGISLMVKLVDWVDGHPAYQVSLGLVGHPLFPVSFRYHHGVDDLDVVLKHSPLDNHRNKDDLLIQSLEYLHKHQILKTDYKGLSLEKDDLWYLLKIPGPFETLEFLKALTPNIGYGGLLPLRERFAKVLLHKALENLGDWVEHAYVKVWEGTEYIMNFHLGMNNYCQIFLRHTQDARTELCFVDGLLDEIESVELPGMDEDRKAFVMQLADALRITAKIPGERERDDILIEVVNAYSRTTFDGGKFYSHPAGGMFSPSSDVLPYACNQNIVYNYGR